MTDAGCLLQVQVTPTVLAAVPEHAGCNFGVASQLHRQQSVAASMPRSLRC